MKSKQERCEHMVISHKHTHTRFAKANQSRNPNGSSSDASSLLAMFGKIFVRLSNERLALVVIVRAQISSSISKVCTFPKGYFSIFMPSNHQSQSDQFHCRLSAFIESLFLFIQKVIGSPAMELDSLAALNFLAIHEQ